MPKKPKLPKYRVTSVSFNLTDPAYPVTAPRVEEIDPNTNVLFGGCKGPWDIEDQYEAFWNRLNDSDEEPKYHTHNATEKVKVVRVEVMA